MDADLKTLSRKLVILAALVAVMSTRILYQ